MKTVSMTTDQMRKRIARFDDVSAQTRDESMPPDLVGELRAETVLGVITSTPPATTASDGLLPKLWETAPVYSGVDNFSAVMVKCSPNQGPCWHIHRAAYENFLPLTGRWRFHWGDPGAEANEELGPYDLISFPPGVARRFENVADTESLMFVFVYSGRDRSIENDGILPAYELARLVAAYGGKSDQHDVALNRLSDAVTTYSQTDAECALVDDVQRLVDAAC